jgi:thiamine-monophosphate kinase
MSGTPGDAAAGLALLQQPRPRPSGHDRYLIERFLRPTPRVELGRALRGVASAAIDVSDGLHADLGKLIAASGVGARLDLERLPLSDDLLRNLGPQAACELALRGGDDYELCLTAHPERRADVLAAAAGCGCAIQEIGVIESRTGLRCFDHGREVAVSATGYDHFGM